MFKALTCFLLSDGWEYPGVDALADRLARHAFRPCAPSERSVAGWVPPRGVDHAPLAESLGGQVLMTLAVESRLLPSSAVREHLEAKMDALEAQTGRRPRGKARRELKEQVEHELLPRAFTRRVTIRVWLDPQARRLVVGSTSDKALDTVLGELSSAFDGGLPLVPLATQLSPSAAMSSWLLEHEAPAGFSIDRDCELRRPDDSRATVRYVRHALDDDGVAEHVRQGKVPVQLAMTWGGRVSFVLTDTLRVRRVKFLDLEVEGSSPEGAASREDSFDADAALATGELAQLLGDLIEALGGLVPDEGAPF